MTNDPKILGLAFIGGIIPSLLWLWFWLREDRKNPEPKGTLAIVFIMGMLSVLAVIEVQRFIQSGVNDENWRLILWAGAEEVLKYLAVIVILYKTKYIDEPIDWPIYMITAALGFAALENALYLIRPLELGQNTVGLLSGQYRFLGSTLLHTVSSGVLGIAMGFSMHMKKINRTIHLLIGLILATALHSVFNFFIIRVEPNNETFLLEMLRVLGFLWVAAIIVMLLFEKLRRMS